MPSIVSLFSCVSRRKSVSKSKSKQIGVHFGVPLSEAFTGDDQLPDSFRDILVYIAREGVSVVNLFRRPGNPKETQKAIEQLQAGKSITVTDYSFFTLANVVKKFLLQIPGGMFGPQVEAQLLSCVELEEEYERIERMHNVLMTLSLVCKQLSAFLFGIWFRMVYHTEVNQMSLEAIAKSVTGSVFHSCTDDPMKVERASKAMEILIGNFSSAALFSADLIEYFTTATKTNISRTEKYCYEFVHPIGVERAELDTFLADILKQESIKHGFDLERDLVSCDQFYAAAGGPPAPCAAKRTQQPPAPRFTAPSEQNVTSYEFPNRHRASRINSIDLSASGGMPILAHRSTKRRKEREPALSSKVESTRNADEAQAAGGFPARSRKVSQHLLMTTTPRKQCYKILSRQNEEAKRSGTRKTPESDSDAANVNGNDSALSDSAEVSLRRATPKVLNGGVLNVIDWLQERGAFADENERRAVERKLADARFNSVRRRQLQRLHMRNEWFNSTSREARDGKQLCATLTMSSPSTPIHHTYTELTGNIENIRNNTGASEYGYNSTVMVNGACAPSCSDHDLFLERDEMLILRTGVMHRTVTALSGPALLEAQRLIECDRPLDGSQLNESGFVDGVNDSRPRQPASLTNCHNLPATTQSRPEAQQPANEVNAHAACDDDEVEEGYVKVARYFIVEKYYGPDCAKSVKFYEQHFARTSSLPVGANAAERGDQTSHSHSDIDSGAVCATTTIGVGCNSSTASEIVSTAETNALVGSTKLKTQRSSMTRVDSPAGPRRLDKL